MVSSTPLMADVRKQKKLVKTSKASARKRARQNLKRRAHNRALFSAMRGQIKHLRASLASKNKKEAQDLLKTTLPVIARMASKGIIHRNAAARYSSRLTQQVNKL